MEIKRVYVKTRAEFGKQCIFDTCGPTMDVEIPPNPSDVNDYLLKSNCHVGVQHSKQLASHEAQTISTTTKNTGMHHVEGGWPKEINPCDEETTARFRRRVEKDDNWAPKLRKLFEIMEQSVRQNGAVNIYQHYFDDMIPTHLVQPLGLRTVNVYADPETPERPVTNISWSPDDGSRIVVSYCFLEFGRLPDYSNRVYIWQVDNPNEPYMALEPFCPCVVCEFNPRDPSVLASGLMTGQVCNWDIRTGTSPVQSSHLQFSHRDYANAVKWLPTKSNTEFFSTSSDGRAMWWDTRWIRRPTEVLMFDLEHPNEPDMEKAIGVSCLNYGPMVGTKFMFGMDNGVILTGSRKAKTNAEKLAVRFEAHYGPVISVDRNEFNPAVFLSVGDWTARVWAEDTREGNLISTPFLLEYPTGGCWNKARYSVFHITTATGRLLTWDLLQNLGQPIFTLQLCKERLTTIAPYEEGVFLAIGNSVGKVFLVESMEFLQSFDKKDRVVLSEFLERCSKMTKAVDVRLKEIKLAQKIIEEEQAEVAAKIKEKAKARKKTTVDGKEKEGNRVSIGRETRRSAQKEKKKAREDLTDLIEAEQKYYEIIDKEMERYATESNQDLVPQRQQLTVAKKQDRKRKKSIQASEEADAKDARKKSIRKKKSSARSGDGLRKSRSPRRVLKREKSAISESGSKRSLADHSLSRSSSRLTSEKSEKKKKRKKKITFALPAPCEGEVCRPKICCWRTDSRRKKKRKQKSGKKASSVSLANLMDESSVRLPRHQASRKSVLREMLEPPSELALEVERAKREIRESAWPSLKRRYIVRRVSKSRSKRSSEGSRETRDDHQKELEEEEEGEEEDSRIETIEDTGEREEIVSLDPCRPPKTKSGAEDFSAILGIPTSTSTEEKKVDGKAYLRELQAARTRIYPRISEFHSIE